MALQFIYPAQSVLFDLRQEHSERPLRIRQRKPEQRRFISAVHDAFELCRQPVGDLLNALAVVKQLLKFIFYVQCRVIFV